MVGHLFDDRQLAILDDAKELVDKHRAPEFGPVRDALAAVGFDVVAFCVLLADALQRTRAALALRTRADNRYQAEAAEVKVVIDAVDRWVKLLHSAVACQKVDGSPDASTLAKLFQVGDVDADDFRDTHFDLEVLIDELADFGDLAALHLPSGFLAEGRALLATLRKEDADRTHAWTRRTTATIAVQEGVDAIRQAYERMATYRAFATLKLGKELPGFELTLLRAANASPSKAPAPVGAAPAAAQPLA